MHSTSSKIDTDTIGLIAGNGKFPILFARAARKKGLRIIAGAVKGDTSRLLSFFVDELQWFRVGELERLLAFFRQKGVKKVIMAGQVDPDSLFDTGLEQDDFSIALFKAMKDRKADTIFSAVADKLAESGIELMDSTFLLDGLLAPKGAFTRRGPSLSELDDIAFGRDIAKSMGGIDIGQTVVIKEKAIVAIEAMEGTDRCIDRGGRIARQGAVVVKMSKPKQDQCFDVPVIGPKTLKVMKGCQANCLAIEAGKTLVIDRDVCVKFADKAGICIVAV